MCIPSSSSSQFQREVPGFAYHILKQTIIVQSKIRGIERLKYHIMSLMTNYLFSGSVTTNGGVGLRSIRSLTTGMIETFVALRRRL